MEKLYKKVKPINAARRFENPSPIFKKCRVSSILEGYSGADIIEVGAGCLRNSFYLAKLGFSVTVLEVEGIQERFPDSYNRFRDIGGKVYFAKYGENGTFTYPCFKNERYGIAIATFVIGTIVLPQERINLLKMVAKILEESGVLILSIRGHDDVLTASAKGIPCSDGYLTPNNTFIRPYDRNDVQILLEESGFENIEFLHLKETISPELVYVTATVKQNLNMEQ